MPPLSPTLQRVHAVVRWLPFVFIVGIIGFATSVLLRLHIEYTLIKRQRYVASIVDIVLVCVLAGMAIWSFLVAVFKSPGYPKGVSNDSEHQRDQRTTTESRWERRERLREEQVGLTEEVEHSDDDGDGDGDDERERNDAAKSTHHADPHADVFDGRGANLLPGQPRMPARTGRSQLNDIVSLVEQAKEQRSDGRLYLGEIQVKNTGVRRWCKQCQCFKPDRAHHCSTCGICVLRMDHHCPWLASRCIGLRNHKAFFLFLAYTALFCCFAAQDTGRALIRFVDEETNGYQSTPITWAVILFLGGIFGLVLVPFTVYHAYLICRNRTTLESMEGAGRVRISVPPSSSGPPRDNVSDRLRKLARGADTMDEDAGLRRRNGDGDAWKRDEELSREERKILRKANKLNIYNIDVRRNWTSVMGERWPMWFVPVGEPESDGYTYEVNENTLRQLETITGRIRDERPQDGVVAPSSNGESVTGNGHRVSGAFSSSSISSIRSKVRSASDAAKNVPSNVSSSPRSGGGRHNGQHQSAHGFVQWGSRPRKDFIMYGLGDEDEDSGGVLGKVSSSSSSDRPARSGVDDDAGQYSHHNDDAQQQPQQMDADVWSSPS